MSYPKHPNRRNLPPLLLSIFLLLLGFLMTSCTDTQAARKAPDFPEGLAWLNVEKPLHLADLRGKVVILDFWTYGCINCIHVMAELKRLQERFGPVLVVIGVHSPKFETEADLEALRHILVRYQRREPVVNDPEYLLMRQYGAHAWPTLALIDPLGGYVARVSGEGHEAQLAQAIERLLQRYRAFLDRTPLAHRPGVRPTEGWFGAPEKIAVQGDRVAVSDSLFHRILVMDRTGTLVYRIGGEEAGFRDGDLHQARFRAPRGLVFGPENRLFVADTGNHAIRLVDLETGRVRTLAGTGRRGLHADRDLDSDPLTLDLRSPWDLALDGDQLYIAMAGDHQIWRFDLARKRLAPYAGSGIEGIEDGPRMIASFSQPSALALQGDRLYVADPESSAVRVIDRGSGQVRTLVGAGLFDFGDRDGALAQARLQHPQGLAVETEHSLLIADTYNQKIKRLDHAKGRLETLIGDGEPGASLAVTGASLDEPGDLGLLGEAILIADTNNRRILSYDRVNGSLRLWPVRDRKAVERSQ